LTEIRVIKLPEYCSANCYPVDMSVRATAEASLVGEEWWVNRVVVEPPTERGKGLGGRLLEALKGVVREAGGRTLFVSPGGYNGNVRAQRRFYRRHGFQPVKGSKGALLRIEFPFDVKVKVGEVLDGPERGA
jgi:GNAT superfamily N-acetyltransferase